MAGDGILSCEDLKRAARVRTSTIQLQSRCSARVGKGKRNADWELRD